MRTGPNFFLCYRGYTGDAGTTERPGLLSSVGAAVVLCCEVMLDGMRWEWRFNANDV